MCYICSCFAWGLDLVQRLITFGLACLLCFAICFGLSIAIVAGIAYGYNYSMAEFITFTRSDVTVFMRRGQFYDKPDLTYKYRRTGAEEDLFSSNSTITDYEDQKPQAESKPLSDTWLKTQDTRKYAEMLTRYAPKKTADSIAAPMGPEPPKNVLPREMPRPTTQYPQPLVNYRASSESPIISIMPNPLLPTVSWRSGSSEIMMRNFKPMQDFTTMNKNTDIPESLFPSPDPKSVSILGSKDKAKESSAEKIRDDYHKSYVPMRVWGTTTHAIVSEEPSEDLDEDNIVYKPV